MWTVLFVASTAVCALGWLSNRIALDALIYFIEKNGYPTPTSEEVDECTRKATKNMFKI